MLEWDTSPAGLASGGVDPNSWLPSLLDLDPSGARLLSPDVDGRTLLHWAASAGALGGARGGYANKTLDQLLSLPASSAALHVADGAGYTALHSAAASGNVTALMALLAAGADTDSRARGGLSPLHLHKGRVEVITALLRGRPPSSASPRDVHGSTPLHRAAGAGQRHAVEALLAAGANAGAADDSGRTPLHLAAEDSSLEVVEMLLDAGAVAGILDHDNKSPADVAPVGPVRARLRAAAAHVPNPGTGAVTSS